MDNNAEIEKIFVTFGCKDFKWMKPADIVVAQWVRMKCTYGCPNYGKSLSCPPNTPSIAECREFFSEYDQSVLFHFSKTVAKPEDRHPWSKEVNDKLLKIERQVFLSGYHKAFALLMNECSICSQCAAVKDQCKQPESVRPVPESMGVDLFATARGCGYPIKVLEDHSQQMNRYALLMVK